MILDITASFTCGEKEQFFYTFKNVYIEERRVREWGKHGSKERFTRRA